jgi:hypothetical protein
MPVPRTPESGGNVWESSFRRRLVLLWPFRVGGTSSIVGGCGAGVTVAGAGITTVDIGGLENVKERALIGGSSRTDNVSGT